jgi:hypothetical protein
MSDQLNLGTTATDVSDKMITSIAQNIAGRNPATFRRKVFDSKMRGNPILVFGGRKNL